MFRVTVNRRRRWEESQQWPMCWLCLHIHYSHGRRTQAWKEGVGRKSSSSFLWSLKESGRNSHCFCTYSEPGTARSFGCSFWSLSKPQNLYGPLCHCFTNMHRDCKSPWSFTTRVLLRACPGALLYSVEGSQSNGSSWSSCEKGLSSLVCLPASQPESA